MYLPVLGITKIFFNNNAFQESNKIPLICKLCALWFCPSTFESISHVILDSIRKRQLSNNTSLVTFIVDGCQHEDVIKWKHFQRYWPFVRGIHMSPLNSPHKGQSLGALMFSLIGAWIIGWVNNHGAGDLRRHRANCDVIVMTRDHQTPDHTLCLVATEPRQLQIKFLLCALYGDYDKQCRFLANWVSEIHFSFNFDMNFKTSATLFS